jgi:hypothetical protein
MNKKIRLLLLLFLTWSLTSFSQYEGGDGIAIGQWRTHLPYQKVIDVVALGDIVYAATPFDLFSYNPGDNSLQRIDKVEGLHDVGVSKIGYFTPSKALLIAYSNTNIDILYDDGTVRNIPDIKNKEILGNKTINNIVFKDDYAYLSCGFGIIVLDMIKLEIRDTWYIGPDGGYIDVQDLTFNDTAFFAATENGIYYARTDSPNLADFNEWHKMDNLPNPNLYFNEIEEFQGRIIANYEAEGWDGDTLYQYDGNSWSYFLPENISRHFELRNKGDLLLISQRYNVKVFDENLEEVLNIWNPVGETFFAFACDLDNSNYYWIASSPHGLIKVNHSGWNGETILPNGPGTQNVYDLDAAGKSVWDASGGRRSDWGKLYMKDGVFSFTDGEWSTHDKNNTPAFDTITDFVCVKIDPSNTQVAYVGTWGKGLLKFENNELTAIYDESNSTLQPWIAATYLTLVSGLDYDDEGNLWVVNSGAPDLLSVMKRDGSWKSFNLGGSLSGIDVSKLMVDSYNQKWILKRSDGFVIVFNDNNTLDNVTDDKAKVLGSSSGNGGIPGSKVYALATDLEGEVWVGSDKGISVFYNPADIFTPGVNFDAQQILVPRNDGSGLADYLLETETVTAIAVDGGNNKWVGTERAGVFLFSPDGLEEIHHFTTDNSPLLSNNIIDIAIDEDGEVFIGTASGIVSFRGEAAEGKPVNDNVYAFPNPVRPGYTGPIAIKGLVNNADVKITDTYGNVVYTTQAEGGQAVWNGYNFDGRRAASGVYVVFVTDSNGEEKIVTKILIIN